MSSLINASTSSEGTPTNGSESPTIVHFDATLRRKDKMKRMAANEQPAAAAAQSATRAAATAVKPPVAATPAAPKAAPVAAHGAGNGSHTAPRTIAAPVAQTARPAAPPKTTAPAPAARPQATASAAKPAGLSGAALEKFLVNFVVEQTGYPEEMVELDADLEADLGIDSIKKAQLFGELSEHFDVQVTEELSLDDFPTLRHVVKFLDGAPQKGAATAPAPVPVAAVAPKPTPVAAAASAPKSSPPPAAQPARPVQAVAAAPRVAAAPVAKEQAPTAPQAATSGLSGAALEKFLINFVVEQTGYPEEMVELDADLEADLGIDSIKKAQLFGELGEYFEVQVTEDLSLDDFPTLRHVLKFLDGVPQRGGMASAAAPAPAATKPVAAAPSSATKAAPVAPTAPAKMNAAPVAAARPVTPSSPVPSPARPVAAAVKASATNRTPAPAPAVQPASAGGEGDLESFLVNFVVEQTGYPPEMVELDADLEADLGIDSIKKAQLFGELSEYFEVQVTEELSLDDFPTLRHVVNFLAGVPRKPAR